MARGYTMITITHINTGATLEVAIMHLTDAGIKAIVSDLYRNLDGHFSIDMDGEVYEGHIC